MLDSGRYGAFLDGMRDLGYVEGRNLVMEARFADGTAASLPSLAAGLAQSKVDAIVTTGTAAAKAAKQATATIPVVMGAASDPVSSGVVASLAKPGGNITGLSLNAVDVSAKHIELIKGLMPALSRVGVLINPAAGAHFAVQKNLQAAAQSVGIKVVVVNAATEDDIDRAFPVMKREGAQAVIVVIDGFLSFRRKQIAELANKNRLPSIFPYRQGVEVGGLMSYGQDTAGAHRRAAVYVDKILKGAKPGDLPVEEPTKFDLAVNMKTAKALGITVPQSILLRADHVIE